MEKFVYAVSKCCGERVHLCPECQEDYVCEQCGDHCELVEGDEDTIKFDKELARADFRNKELKENQL